MRLVAVFILGLVAAAGVCALVWWQLSYPLLWYCVALASLIAMTLIVSTMIRDWARASIRRHYQSSGSGSHPGAGAGVGAGTEGVRKSE